MPIRRRQAAQFLAALRRYSEHWTAEATRIAGEATDAREAIRLMFEMSLTNGVTLRRDLVNVPARFAAPARKPMLHLPAHWPWQIGWKTLWNNIIGHSPVIPRAG